MMFGQPMYESMGDPRRRGFFRRFRAPRFMRGINIHRLRGLGEFVPGPLGTAMSQFIGDPGKGRAVKRRHARAGHGHRLAKMAKHAGGFLSGLVSAGASFAEAHPGISGFLTGEAGSIPFVGGGLQSLAQQAGLGGGGGGEAPTLEDASAVTGLPTSHPHTRRVHGMMGGRRRRVNAANVHALRRAERRMTGFVKLYKRTAGHLGYHLVRAHAAHGMRKGRKRA